MAIRFICGVVLNFVSISNHNKGAIMKRLFLLTLIGMVMLNALYAQSTVPNVWSVPATKSWFASTGDNVRGMGYNPVNNHVYVASRLISKVIILNAATGDSIGALNMTGIAGGTYAFNRIAVSADGRIYTTNLVTTVTKAAPLKIYSWADEVSAPVLVFSDSVQGPRLGDALAVVGSGQNTYVYASGNASPGPVHIFKRFGDSLLYYKKIALSGWGAYGVLGFGPTTNGIGDFWVNTAGNTARKFDSTGAALDTLPGGIVSSGGSTVHYFEHAGRKYVGVYSGNTSPSVFRFADVTDGGAKSFVAGITASLGTTTNGNGTGEIVYNPGDSSLYAIATNNSIGKFSINMAAPTVTYNSRTPFVPRAGQNDTMLFNILSMKQIKAAKLFYYGNSTAVSDQAVVDSSALGVAMTPTSYRVYSGIVPGSVNRDGRRVNFRGTAVDTMGVATNTVTFNGYFAGTTKLALVNGPRDIDTAGAMRWIGYGIRVQGVCTQEDSLIAIPTGWHDVVVQDAQGGTDIIQLSYPTGVAAPWRMKRGNLYSAAGLMAQYYGKLQIGIPGASGTNIEVVDLGPGMSPVPASVTIRDLAFDRKGEMLENALVRISNLRLTVGSLAWPAAGAAGTNITVTDNGVDSLTLRVPALSSANGLLLKQPFTVIGVAGQYDAASPYKEGYQVIMRQVDDIIPELVLGLKDTTKAVAGTEVVLPVLAGNITGTSITAFQFTAQFDTTALQFVSANGVGTLSAGYTFATNLVKNGNVQIAAFGTQALKDSGAIFNYRFKVLKVGSSVITLTGKLNEGNPFSMVNGGVVVGGAATETEPNDSLSFANPLTLGVEINGTLSSATGDPDFFWFTTTRGHLIVDVTDAANTTDADIYLMDSTGKVLYTVDRNNNDRLEFNLTYAGKYVVKVAGYYDGATYATGAYKLLARIGTATDANEPNDGPLFGFMNFVTPMAFDKSDTTNTLDPGVGIPGNDYDYFSIIAAPGQTITALIQSKSFKSTSTLNGVQGKIYRKATFPTGLVTQETTTGADVTCTYTVAVADTYYVRIINSVGAEAGPNARYKLTIAKPTGVIENMNALPLVFALDQNYPNPFNPTTAIRFALPQQMQTSLVIYDLLGREVRTLVNNSLNAGYYEEVWDGRNNLGVQAATGVYAYRMQAGKFVDVKKMMLLK